MKSLNIAEIILNPIFGARILWPAICEFQKTARESIPLPLTLLVLPIALHQRSRKFIFNMNKTDGSISKAINKKGKDFFITGNDLALGLQERLDYTIPLTFSSLNIGISSGLIAVDKNSSSPFPSYSTTFSRIPSDIAANTDDETDEKMKASARLGGVVCK